MRILATFVAALAACSTALRKLQYQHSRLTNLTSACADTDSPENCGYWAGLGYCSPSSEYYQAMQDRCCSTCGFGGGCTDTDSPDNCGYWAGLGYCSPSSEYYQAMQDRCCSTCGFGGGPAPTPLPTPTPTSAPTPSPSETCESQWGNMACTGTECYTCGDRITHLINDQGYSSSAARTTVGNEFPAECGACSGGGGLTPSPQPSPGPCSDENEMCGAWAAYGECENNPGYMLVACRLSCGVCSSLPAPTPPPAPTPSGTRVPLSSVCFGGSGSSCVIPAGTNTILDSSVDVGSLTIRGKLTWDTSRSNLVLRAGFVMAEGQGEFELGTPYAPMLNPATIYIKNNGQEYKSPAGQSLGTRAVGSAWTNGTGPKFRVHGRPLSHTWALLVQNAEAGSNSIRVDRDVANPSGLAGGGNWRVGDWIGIAPTGMMGNRYGETKEITSLSSNGQTTTIYFNGQLGEAKLGDPGMRMQAEVVLLTRSVTITGDDSGDQGWHGIGAWGQFAPNPRDGGSYRVEYARAEKCGQARVLGRYCLHFHLMGDCGGESEPRCLMRGNAVEWGHQRGLTVHGTHLGVVDKNVLWDVKGAGIYIEDGNEMGNTISENVVVCPGSNDGCASCKVSNTDNEQADDIQQSGIWALSPTNDFLYNRVVNTYNGFFLQTSAFPFGKGFAADKVCTIHSPWGEFKGNAHHSGCRFGFYPDNNFPRRLKRSVASNGMVEDFQRGSNAWNSCDEFTIDGRDNGAPGIVADGLDWGYNLVGQYDLGDIQYLRLHTINNLHNMYWKRTKNFATLQDMNGETWETGTKTMPSGTLPVAHMKDCISEETRNPDVTRIMGGGGWGVAQLFGPGGLGAFIIDGGRYTGESGVAIGSNQHCNIDGVTGALCTPVYELRNVDTSAVDWNTKMIQFGVESGDNRLPMYSSNNGGGLGGHLGAAPSVQSHLLGLPGGICRRSGDSKYDDAIFCDRPLRRLQLWAAESNPPPRLCIVGGSGACQDMFYVATSSNTKRGYGISVVPGYSYRLERLNGLPGDPGITLEFSDTVYGNALGGAEQISLTVATNWGVQRDCVVSSQHTRRFIGPNGPLRDGSGACTTGGGGPFPTPAPAPTRRRGGGAPTPGGGSGVFCNPFSNPPQVCPGGIPCPQCGVDPCECPR